MTTDIRTPSKLESWNVRRLVLADKLRLVEIEMERHNISLLGLCETHWRENDRVSD